MWAAVGETFLIAIYMILLSALVEAAAEQAGVAFALRHLTAGDL